MSNIKVTDFGFITFSEEEIPDVIEMSGYKINKKGYVIEGRETKRCISCDKAITTKRLGHVLPGSKVMCCDNPVCFAHYVNEYLKE